MFQGCLTIDRPRSFCLLTSRNFAHLAASGLVSMMLHCMIVEIAKLVDQIDRDAQDRLLWRQDLSRTYLAHHELESNCIISILTRCQSLRSSDERIVFTPSLACLLSCDCQVGCLLKQRGSSDVQLLLAGASVKCSLAECNWMSLGSCCFSRYLTTM